MKKSLGLIIFISVIFTAMLVSCKKSNHSEDKSVALTVEDAKAYLQRLESKYGNYDTIKIDGTTRKNFKQVDFSKAYVGENERSFFIEAPISYTTREVVLRTNSGLPTSTLNKMAGYSFDRFVVYKDKMSGMVSEKIVTIIPSVDYISNGNKDLHENHYQSIVKGFSGFVSSKNWKGKFLSTQSYNLGAAQTKTARVNGGTCEFEAIYRTILICEDFDQYGNPVNCYNHEIYMGEQLVCTADPIPNQPPFNGWPDPQTIPPPSSCPSGPRMTESPIIGAGIALDGSSFKVQFVGGCECPGYSFLILEDVTTGTEYSFPIDTHNYLLPDCYSFWETDIQIPASVPNGQYFIKCWFDGDTFYHQLENVHTQTIISFFKHTLSR